MNLSELEIGHSAKITATGGKDELRQHFLDMGLIPGVEITLVKFAPMGDPLEFRIYDYELTLRLADAQKIQIEPLEKISISTDKNEIPLKSAEKTDSLKAEHPGFGESSRFNHNKTRTPLSDETILTYALVGNQNCGKTTLFNCLTGSNQHVGNFPGVTVDRKDGLIKGNAKTLVTDLPGIYSMSPYSSEEIISRNFVLKEKPKAIINIVDSTNIERNLYLTMQLLEMDTPVVVALNMMDELSSNGGAIDINKMEQMLGVPVVPVSAAKNQGVDELVDHALYVARFQEKPLTQDFCDENDYNGAVHRCLHAVSHIIQDHAQRIGMPVRFAASKVVEGDKITAAQLDLDQNELETIEHLIIQMEKESSLDRSAAVAAMRYKFIMKVCSACVKKPKESLQRKRSEKIDRILTGKWTAMPAFILIMAGIFYLTFNLIGAFFQNLLAQAIEKITELTDSALYASGVNEAVHSLIIDGIFAGVGSVLSFLPVIVVLFFFLSILEDSGYIARVAFVMDKLLRKIGLSGRSIVPLLIGFGCTVPAVMSTRILPSERDRRMTILLTPFMSCSAKLPIYAFFVSAFFPGNGAVIMTGLYVLGIFAGIGAAFLYKSTIFKGEAVPFVMELPNYRLPGIKNVSHLLWEKAKDFLTRAFTVIFFATIIVWFLQKFDFHLNMVEHSKDSMLAVISGAIVPLFKPLGMGSWEICTSLISGFIAKESVVSTMEILFAQNVATAVSELTAVTMLVFSLLYTPCVAAVSSIKREMGWKWATGVVLWQCTVAWLLAFAAHTVFSFIF